MRIALCHEWLTTFGGSEQVAQRIASAIGVDDVFAFTVDQGMTERVFPDRTVMTAHPVGNTSFARRRWQWLLPVMPLAWRSLDLSSYDIVVTSSHACVNAITTRPDAPVISYCHTPMRYAWEWRSELRRLPVAVRPAWPIIAALLRRADRRWAQRVDRFVANSQYVADRIELSYSRKAEVVYPPIDTDFWTPAPTDSRGDFFLFAGRLVPYKRPDLAVRAANLCGARLVVAGQGPELKRLQRIAGNSVDFVIDPSNDELRDLYRRASALVFPGVEDFGMMLVEAQACGTPVIAYDQGGAREAVDDGRTGVLYPEPSAEALAREMSAFRPERYLPSALRAHAMRFSIENFDSSMQRILHEVTVGGEVDRCREQNPALAS